MKRSGVRPSLSVSSIDRQQQRRAAGLLLSARWQEISIDSRRRLWAANAGSVAMTAGGRG